MTQSLFVQLGTGTVHISVQCIKKMLFVLSHSHCMQTKRSNSQETWEDG